MRGSSRERSSRQCAAATRATRAEVVHRRVGARFGSAVRLSPLAGAPSSPRSRSSSAWSIVVELRLAAVAAAREAGDERRRVVEVRRRRQDVGVRPEGVARVAADGIRDRLPHRGGLAQAPRAQLEADEGRERRLGRSAGRPAAAHRLGDRRRPAAGASVASAVTTSTQPSISASMVSRRASAASCSSRLRRDERAARHGLAQLLGVRRVESARELLEAVGVDA